MILMGWFFCCCAKGDIYVCTTPSGSPTETTKRYNRGVKIWGVNHGASVNGIEVDSNGFVYTGGEEVAGDSNNTTRKYNHNGVLQWSVAHGADVQDITVDSSGNMVAVGGTTVRYYNSSGTEQWNASPSGTLLSCAFNSTGDVYIGGTTSVVSYLEKYNSTGASQWSVNPASGSARCICLDTVDDIYVGCSDDFLALDQEISKWDSTGSEIVSESWPVAGAARFVLNIVCDPSDNIYAAFNATSVSFANIFRKYNQTGTQQYSFTKSINANRGLAIDTDGGLYYHDATDAPTGVKKRTFNGGADEAGIAISEVARGLAWGPGRTMPFRL